MVRENFSKEEEQMRNDFLKSAAVKQAAQTSVTRKIRKLRNPDGAEAPKIKRKKVRYEPDYAWTEAAAQEMAPAKYKLHRDRFNKCWRLRKGSWSLSKSWGPSGKDASCLVFLLTRAWERHCSLNPLVANPYDFEEVFRA